MTKFEIRFGADLGQASKIGLAINLRERLRDLGHSDFVITDGTFSVGAAKAESFVKRG